MSAVAKGKPGGNRASMSAYLNAHRYIPVDFRERVAARAGEYYPLRVRKLGTPNGDGWASCCCPFHQDKTASASANLRTGGYRCHACGEHGDLIAFHMKRTGLEFKACVRDLLGLPS